jgi:hypothetical protein
MYCGQLTTQLAVCAVSFSKPVGLRRFSEGSTIKNFEYLIPDVAKCYECFLARHALIVCLLMHDDVGIADSGPRNEVLNLSLAKTSASSWPPIRDQGPRGAFPSSSCTGHRYALVLLLMSQEPERLPACENLNFLSCIVSFCTVLHI